MRMYTYIETGMFPAASILVWDRLRFEAQSLGRPDELLIVHTAMGTVHDVARLCPKLMTAVGVDSHTAVGASHPLVRGLKFDTRLRLGRIVVGDDGTVQVRPRVWSIQDEAFRLDMDNVDGEGENAFGEIMKTFRLTEKQMAAIGFEMKPEPPTFWTHLLDEDGL